MMLLLSGAFASVKGLNDKENQRHAGPNAKAISQMIQVIGAEGGMNRVSFHEQGLYLKEAVKKSSLLDLCLQ